MKERWKKLLHWEHFGISLIVLVTLIMHFSVIMIPGKVLFDEAFYVGDARSILQGTGTLRPEHPPLGKFFIAMGVLIFDGFSTPLKNTGEKTQQVFGSDRDNDTVIEVSDASKFSVDITIEINAEQMEITNIDSALNKITVKRGVGGTTVSSHAAQQTIYLFTDNPFGWRFFSVIAGTISLILFYLICRELSMPKIAVLISTFLLAFESISFVQSSVGMLDVFTVVFSMATFYLYLRRKYLPAGIFAVLSVLAKLNGALVVPVMVLHWLIARRDKKAYFIGSMILAPVWYFLLLPIINFMIQGYFQNPVTITSVMIKSTESLTFANVTHEVRQVPWDWLIHRLRIAYWFTPNYFGNLSIDIWWLAIPIAVYLFLRSLWKNRAAWFGLSWFIGTYVLWIPIVLVTDRVTYGYYIYPTVGAFCIGLGLALTDVLKLGVHFKAGKFKWVGFGVVIACLVGHFAVFAIFSPVFSRWFG